MTSADGIHPTSQNIHILIRYHVIRFYLKRLVNSHSCCGQAELRYLFCDECKERIQGSRVSCVQIDDWWQCNSEADFSSDLLYKEIHPYQFGHETLHKLLQIHSNSLEVGRGCRRAFCMRGFNSVPSQS